MGEFLTDDFLLTTRTARRLYHDYAENQPIVDYHCHVSPREIYEDRHFENITQIWLAGDHYKWRLLRANGVDENEITGSASDWEKFAQFARTLPRAIGSPLYHWCHMELKTYFGYDGVLNADTAREVWELTGKTLRQRDFGVREILRHSNVVFIGTTDDPIDSLQWHKQIAEDPAIGTVVSPTFRPDHALEIAKPGWRDYIQKLSAAAGIAIGNLASLQAALAARMAYFAGAGCRASDHGLDYVCCREGSEQAADAVIQKALAGAVVTGQEAELVKTRLLLFCAEQYHRLGWVMQLHFNCLRNPNTAMFRRLGADAGFDCIAPHNGAAALARLLDRLYQQDRLPRSILYSLDPGDNTVLDALIGAFQGGVPGKLQHGSAWWFNDHKQGIRDHLTSLASQSVLGNFVGMLTDSRSFLSYVRHAYFRRILCQLLGQWVENGEYPADFAALEEIVRDICCRNALHYFSLEAE